MDRGYIALITTIIISLTLLMIISEQSFAGWQARFNVLNTEAKAASRALASGCVDQVLMGLIIDRSYTDTSTTTFSNGLCVIYPVNQTNPNMIEIKVQAQVNEAYTNLMVKTNHLFTPLSWQELPL
ncbi:MAG: hypothetical protein HYV76_00945 [Candidatus Vogelbacteria bacterium]|nr:hypothetical protein [Candidatus Vogelbacteria bacterium]